MKMGGGAEDARAALLRNLRNVGFNARSPCASAHYQGDAMQMTEDTTVASTLDAEIDMAAFSDADLLDAWNEDEHREAFAELVSRYSVLVLSVCRRRCRSQEDADDAYQSTFLHLARNSRKIRRPECLPGWLHRVAQRAANATLSERRTTNEVMTEPATNEQSPLDRITQRHESLLLDEELADLPEQYRATLVMHLYEGYSLNRLAEHFRTSLGTIRGRLQRGKKLLASRLRRRGVVPILAFAAAGASTVTVAESAAASTPLLATLSSGPVPPPPLDPHLFDPLLSNGTRLMNSWNLIGGLAAAGTLSALMMLPGDGGETGAGRKVLIHPVDQPLVAQFGGDVTAPAATGGHAAAAPPPTQMMWRREYRAQQATSVLAGHIREELETSTILNVAGNFESLLAQLESQCSFPIILDERAVKFAQLTADTPLKYVPKEEPLSTALRKLLHPLGLKVRVEDEALVITADHAALVHWNIGATQWLTVDDEKMKEYRLLLETPIESRFIETPLEDAVKVITELLNLPIVIDKRALEEIGLTSDAPVTCEFGEIPTQDLLSKMLRDLDLTMNFQDNLLTVTTLEAADTDLLGRIYWLEGLNVAGDYDSLINLIQTTIEPEAWEAMGGTSTMSPFPAKRPAIVINTTYSIHMKVEKLIDAFRKNSLDRDYEATEVQVPIVGRQSWGGGLGGGGLGGGGLGSGGLGGEGQFGGGGFGGGSGQQGAGGGGFF